MEEIFDHLLIRILFTALLIGILYGYRYAHLFLYPQGKKQVIALFNPLENTADTIHYMARIIGICIVFTSFEVHLFENILMSVLHFLFWTTVDIIFYLLSLYLMELIVLHSFQYQQEILKRKNITFAIINAALAICLAILIQNIIEIADYSIPMVIILWLFMIVVFGLLVKQFHLISHYHFSKAVFSKDPGVAISYVGYLLATTMIVYSAFNQEQKNITNFIATAFTNLLLCGILLPLFYYGIRNVFLSTRKMTMMIYDEELEIKYDLGIAEAMLFLAAAFLTSIVVFGSHLYGFSI